MIVKLASIVERPAAKEERPAAMVEREEGLE